MAPQSVPDSATPRALLLSALLFSSAGLQSLSITLELLADEPGAPGEMKQLVIETEMLLEHFARFSKRVRDLLQAEEAPDAR